VKYIPVLLAALITFVIHMLFGVAWPYRKAAALGYDISPLSERLIARLAGGICAFGFTSISVCVGVLMLSRRGDDHVIQ
jgi:hypothetical protein